MKEQLERIKERAEWHLRMADDYENSELPYGKAAAQQHKEMAHECWNRYGRLLAKLDTAETWGMKEFVHLRGAVLK